MNYTSVNSHEPIIRTDYLGFALDPEKAPYFVEVLKCL